MAAQTESPQRVTRRSWIFWRLLIGLAVVAAGLFVYTVFQQNLVHPDGSGPPQILDIQSATATLLATSGALLARAQYATAVRPMIGFTGRARRGVGPQANEIVWLSGILNGSQDAAAVSNVGYAVRFTGADPVEWVGYEQVVRILDGRGLRLKQDYDLLLFGRGHPLPANGRIHAAWFTGRAISEILELGLSIELRDRVGDSHTRSMNLLKGCPTPPLVLESPEE